MNQNILYGLSQVAQEGSQTPSNKMSVWGRIIEWLECSYQNGAAQYLSQSVDRTDLEYRERQLKYKGLL